MNMKWLLALALLWPACAGAAESVLPTPGPGDVAVSLGGIILVILVLAWGMRRLRLPGGMAGSQGIRIIAAMPVGARDRLVIVEVGGEQLLVGMSPGRMQTLHVLPRPVASTAAPAASGGFAARLREAMGGRPE